MSYMVNPFRFVPAAPGPGISLVGIASASIAAGGGAGGLPITVDLTTIAGLAQNDVCFTFAFLPRTSGGGTGSSGWTQIHTVDSTNRAQCYRKVMGASPDTSFVQNSTTNAVDAAVCIVVALRGVNTSTPEDATPTNAFAAATADPDNPSITTVTANAWVLAFAGSRANDASVGTPTNYINTASISGNGSSRNAQAYVATREIASPGAENPSAWTTWTAQDWIAITVAVRPA